MARDDALRPRARSRKEPYRVQQPSDFKSSKSEARREWKAPRKSKGVVKSTNATAGPLKRRLRDLSRLLSKNSNLPADVKIGREREIQALQHELVGVLLDKERHEMIGKYHMVRFFERQRATRRLKSAKKALDACDDDTERQALEKQVHIAQVDLDYTQYYPHMAVYQSLWTKENEQDGTARYIENNQEADGAKGNISMWREVEKAMQAGTLEKLRDSADQDKEKSIRQVVTAIGTVSHTNGKAKDERDGDAEDDEAEDDTGIGFFE